MVVRVVLRLNPYVVPNLQAAVIKSVLYLFELCPVWVPVGPYPRSKVFANIYRLRGRIDVGRLDVVAAEAVVLDEVVEYFFARGRHEGVDGRLNGDVVDVGTAGVVGEDVAHLQGRVGWTGGLACQSADRHRRIV